MSRNETQETPETGLPAGLSNPARRALIGAGCVSLDEVAKRTEKELRALHGMGPKALELLRRTLAAEGRSFAD